MFTLTYSYTCCADRGTNSINTYFFAELFVLEEPLVGLILEDAGVVLLEALQDGLAIEVSHSGTDWRA